MAKRKSTATGSGRDPSRKRGSQYTTGVFRSIRDEVGNRPEDLGRVSRPEDEATRGDLVFESGHEQDCLIALDVEPWVERLATQPETFILSGRRSYTPDIRADAFSGERRFIEVKPDRIIRKDPTLRGRVEEIREAAAKREASFEILSEDYYRSPNRIANAHLLRHSARWRLPVARARVLEIMKLYPAGAPLLEIVRALGMGLTGRFAVLGLVALGVLRMNLAEKISPHSRVCWPGNDE